ncbi:hypothetical protein OG900_10535 [Streptomyces sp. NBC_00433]
MPEIAPPAHASVLQEVREVRRAGIVQLRRLKLPALEAAATMRLGQVTPEARAVAVEQLLHLAVGHMGSGTLQDAAAYSLGLVDGTRDWAAADRRRKAAGVYGISVERFRKHQELIVLEQVADQVLRMTGASLAGLPAEVATLTTAHRTLTVSAGGHTSRLTLHVHPVDLLRDVDVMVTPTNTYLALPEPYKSSVSASLRRAGASSDATGALLADHIGDELHAWTARHDARGRAVTPGTVVPTGSGALAEQGVRRLYHAALAVPRPGTNDYDVEPTDITRCVTRAFGVLAAEHAGFDPPLRSICLPLLGAGRGGLRPEVSVAAMWAAIEAELLRGAPWDVHLLVRKPERAETIVWLLTGRRPRDGIAVT